MPTSMPGTNQPMYHVLSVKSAKPSQAHWQVHSHLHSHDNIMLIPAPSGMSIWIPTSILASSS